jgi:hypothetical protein
MLFLVAMIVGFVALVAHLRHRDEKPGIDDPAPTAEASR